MSHRRLQLRTLTGPQLTVHDVAPGSSAVIGRLPTSDVCLLHENVSRTHAKVAPHERGWAVTDLGSSGGTFLNSVKLQQGDATPLLDGDTLRIGPWTFRLSIGDGVRHGLTGTTDDLGSASGTLSRLKVEGLSVIGRRLRLLTQCIGKLSTCGEPESLAAIALEMVMQGATFGRGAILRAGLAGGEAIDVFASRRADASDASPFSFSRSLIQAASGMGGMTGAKPAGSQPGTFVLAESSQPVGSHSIIQMSIHSAVCAPIMLGEVLWGLLYLDARASEAGVAQDAAEFCEAVATALGLSLANLRRAGLERQQQELTAELNAAREVQETIMPLGEGRAGAMDYAVRVLPGQVVAGDLFDVLELPGGRAAFFMGDVAGHGAGSGMLMAMTQSHMAALLRATGDLVGSVRAANEYLSSRISGGRFASLWAGILEPDGLLRCVDAGHGLWFVRAADGSIRTQGELGGGRGGVPLGISSDSPYEPIELQLQPGDRVVLFSDGVIEQRSPEGEYFSIERLRSVIADSPDAATDVRRVFDDLLAFAAGARLDDDATVASGAFMP